MASTMNLLLLLAAVIVAASALPVSVNSVVPPGLQEPRLGAEPLPPAGPATVPAGALLACNTGACIQRCRSQWAHGGSCQRGLCICV